MALWTKSYEQLGFKDDCASVLEVDRVQEIISRRAERFKVRVNWDRTAATAMTTNVPTRDGHYNITLPAIKSPCTNEDLVRTYMYVVHECGHLMRPKVWDIANAAKPCPELMSLFNIVEDDSMERDVAGRHLGDARTLGEGNAIMAKDGELFWIEELAKAKAEGTPITEESLLPMIVMAIQLLSRRQWDGWSREAVDAWLKCMPPEGQPLLTQLVKEGWVDKLRATKDEYDSWNLSCDLYARLFPQADMDLLEEMREAGNTGTPRECGDDTEDGERSGEEEDVEGADEGHTRGEVHDRNGEEDASTSSSGDKANGGISRGSGSSDADKSPHEESSKIGDPQACETGPEDSTHQGYVIDWQQIVMSEHDMAGAPTGGAAGITYEGKVPDSAVAFMPDKENNVLDLTSMKNPRGYLAANNQRKWSRSGRPAEDFNQQDRGATVLANKVRRYVQSQSRTKFRSEREHGKINGQEITRLLLPPIDGGKWNSKVFYDHKNHRALNTAVHILVDWSGSMGGDKQVYAAAAAMRCADVFGRCLRMPVMVSSFTTNNGRHSSDIAIIKHFDKPRPAKEMQESFGAWAAWSGGNNDADGVMWAYRRLMERKEQRRLLIVMSDGAPAGSYIGHAHDALLAATRQIQDEGVVELFGLGIRSDAVGLYYDNFEVVSDLSDINPALLEVLKRSITYV